METAALGGGKGGGGRVLMGAAGEADVAVLDAALASAQLSIVRSLLPDISG